MRNNLIAASCYAAIYLIRWILISHCFYSPHMFLVAYWDNLYFCMLLAILESDIKSTRVRG